MASTSGDPGAENASLEPRVRISSEKGLELFQQQHDKLLKHVETAWSCVGTIIGKIDLSSDVLSITHLERELNDSVSVYLRKGQDLLDFCVRAHTKEGNEAAQRIKSTIEMNNLTINEALQSLASHLKSIQRDDSTSVASRSSRSTSKSSQRSNLSSVICKAKAKAEAAKVRLKYAELEAELKRKQALLEENQVLEAAKTQRQKTDLTIDLELLNQKCETEAVNAEAEALEASDRDFRSVADSILPQVESVDPCARTEEYIQTLRSPNVASANSVPDIRTSQTPERVTSGFIPEVPTRQPFGAHSTNITYQEPPVNPASEASRQQPLVSDLTRFLLKKDLLLSRLTMFNDSPERYSMWKSSFKSIMTELDVTPVEEMDLLQKWTGPESNRHVISVKAANVSNPAVGLERIWERLEDRYGCPELLESSIKKRIESFPKLTVKDSRKLYELADLVSEIEAMKNDSKMKSLFAHYDSSTGVTPIVNKLPHNLQEKWTLTASKYMAAKHVVYPPFSIFVQFVREQSKIRNNPCFAYDAPKNSLPPKARERTVINVKKTDTKEDKRSAGCSVKNSNQEICPLHGTSHSLNKCRVFRTKPIKERLQFLREKGICFKCCTSTSHFKRDCICEIRCSLCQSENHPSALHVDAYQANGFTSAAGKGHGGESANSDPEPRDISVACTSVCGDRFPGKSCAKIVLGKVQLRTEPNKAVRLYAIIDDQSNRSMASSRLFDLLGVQGNKIEYVLTSCSGKMTTAGRRLEGLVIESYDETTRIPLPTITECDFIPDNRDEIPTPQVAQCYSHLQNIASQIPPLNQEAEILLLIGRDAIYAHHVLDQRIGPGSSPYAQKLPLGWTIIGETCLGRSHIPEEFTVNKTAILDNGRGTLFEPCTSRIMVNDSPSVTMN